jgi:DNA-binding GntR family transcriptional regulator
VLTVDIITYLNRCTGGGYKASTPFQGITLREQVAGHLRKSILCGDIKPGEKINEVEVARQLSISRGPVREALRQIEQEGFLSYAPNKGCTVITMSPRNMAELYLLRSALEILAVQAYEGQMRESSVRGLQEKCDNLHGAAQKNDLAMVVEIDQEFHGAIVREAGLPMLFKTWSGFDGGNAAIYYTMYNSDLLPSQQHLKDNHQVIVDAFASGDTEKIVATIREHYMIVPKALYQHNRQEPDELFSRF